MKIKFTLPFLMVLFVTIEISAQGPDDVTTVFRKDVDLPEIRGMFTINGDYSTNDDYLLNYVDNSKKTASIRNILGLEKENSNWTVVKTTI